MNKKRIATICAICIVLTGQFGCGQAERRISLARSLIAKACMTPLFIKTSSFTLAGDIRVKSPGAPLVVYIEGDGFAWINKNTISNDPTPKNPVALRLAVCDPADNVAYLARPCQYVPERLKVNCSSAYWTSTRFSLEVIKAMDEAIDQLKEKASASKLHLVGYSGGAAVAALLAERRDDILSLRTVAGNLDHEALNNYHHVSPLRNSLNPIDEATRLKNLPQIHFTGTKDKIVPGFIASNFVKAQGSDRCTRIVRVQAGHGKGWAQKWPHLLRQYTPDCR